MQSSMIVLPSSRSYTTASGLPARAAGPRRRSKSATPGRERVKVIVFDLVKARSTPYFLFNAGGALKQEWTVVVNAKG
jgi:hypothetical protein